MCSRLPLIICLGLNPTFLCPDIAASPVSPPTPHPLPLPLVLHHSSSCSEQFCARRKLLVTAHRGPGGKAQNISVTQVQIGTWVYQDTINMLFLICHIILSQIPTIGCNKQEPPIVGSSKINIHPHFK